jgi:hypothetical protein
MVVRTKYCELGLSPREYSGILVLIRMGVRMKYCELELSPIEISKEWGGQGEMVVTASCGECGSEANHAHGPGAWE